jgi:hypothetical protein
MWWESDVVPRKRSLAGYKVHAFDVLNKATYVPVNKRNAGSKLVDKWIDRCVSKYMISHKLVYNVPPSYTECFGCAYPRNMTLVTMERNYYIF